LKIAYARLLTFFIGIPSIVCIVLFLPQLNHLAFSILVIAASVIGSAETAAFYKNRGIPSGRVLPIACSALFPIAAYLEIAGLINISVAYLALPLVLWIILLAGLFNQTKEKIASTLSRIGSNLIIALYPGVLAAFVVRIGGLSRPELGFLIFIVPIFLNDSMAYVFGMLFGKNNRGIFPASEKKSIAGLVAGLSCSIGGTALFYAFFPDYFNSSLALALILGGGVGIAAVAGDLAVSTLKRSAGVKDSGKLIPGRGGVLDSVDSIVFAAPVFYLLIRYFT
jgi:phosphatidate cytidylyltransferase